MSATRTVELVKHPETGWLVDGSTGQVYGVARRHKGKVIGSLAKTGYLVSSASGGRDYLLHRVVWEACVGPMRHAMATGLKPRTGGAAGRRGTDHHSYRVTPEMRADILRLGAEGAKQRDIALRHGISQRTVWAVLHGLAR